MTPTQAKAYDSWYPPQPSHLGYRLRELHHPPSKPNFRTQ